MKLEEIPGSETEVKVTQLLGLVFVLGVSVGLLAGIAVPLGTQPAASGNQNTDSQVVSLENTDYPFQGIEAGIGTESAENSTYDVEGEPYIGSGDTKMIAYEDFECPFCKRFHENSFPQVIDNDVRNGDVRFYFKNYPLQRLHPWAVDSAIASECALNQDEEAYWTFNKGFFSNQKALSSAYKSGEEKFDESMVRWAEQTGLDVQQFESCYNNQEEMEEVREDAQQGGRLGTPTFFIGSSTRGFQKLSGAQPYRLIKQAIDGER